MLWDKGIEEFVEAARILKDRNVKIIFQLVGGLDNDNPAAISEAQLFEWQKEKVVKWLGFQEDMVTIYHNSHIVCLPSYREGLPKALIEAMACGRAIITTDVPGCKEVVENGLNGFLVPVKDALALAEHIYLLSQDTALMASMGKNGRLKAEKEFSLSKVISQTLAVYQELDL
jgi:glycosyltransferase involved in cell wall biosynthesis